MRLAALTMVYNEPLWARVWVRHYAALVGAENCVVLDHGSDDGSTEGLAGLGVRVERMRRGPLDEDARAALISDCVAALLRRYDAVVHTDADELLVAAPGSGGLAGCAALGEAVTAVGLDLQHLPDEEGALDPAQALGMQRGWVRFSGAMCKPALVRAPVRWSPGFHACDRARVVGPMVLVHLRYADLAAALQRLARTRGQSFARADANMHQRVSDRDFETMMRDVARLPRVEGGLEEGDRLAGACMGQMEAGWAEGVELLGYSEAALWQAPAWLRAAI